MKTVTVRNTVFGEGTPKICVPLTGKTADEILSEIAAINGKRFDAVEWRIDNLTDLSRENVEKTAHIVRENLGDAPLLATCRTKKEGGYADITVAEYIALNKTVCESGCADLIDIEICTGDEAVAEMIENAHRNGVFVVASNHDFDKTPCEDEIVKRLAYMEKCGADIGKIALMPQSKKDVLTLLCATERASREVGIPLITMSMGRLGTISRMCGEVFGSCLTFGAAKNASAPGQINSADLGKVLDIIHESV